VGPNGDGSECITLSSSKQSRFISYFFHHRSTGDPVFVRRRAEPRACKARQIFLEAFRERAATRSLERSPSGCWKRPSPVLTDLAGRPAASARLASPRGAVSDILPRGRAHPLRAAADRRTDTVIRDRCERPPRRHARPKRQWSARRPAGTARAPRRQAAGIRPEIPSRSCAGTIAATSPLFGQAPLPATPARAGGCIAAGG
jgi:hypothetical protein